MAEDEDLYEEDLSDKEQEYFDEDVDNDEISPEEEGFLQGYEATEEKEKQEKQTPEEE